MNRDVDNNILHVGDRVLIIGGEGMGGEATVSDLDDDQFVRMAWGGHKAFGKYPYNIRLVIDPDLRVDEGL